MNALVYKVNVCEGLLAFSHGFERTIMECYVPEKRLFFNYTDNKLNFFSGSKKDRVPKEVRKIRISDELVNDMLMCLSLQAKISKEVMKLLAKERESISKEVNGQSGSR